MKMIIEKIIQAIIKKLNLPMSAKKFLLREKYQKNFIIHEKR